MILNGSGRSLLVLGMTVLAGMVTGSCGTRGESVKVVEPQGQRCTAPESTARPLLADWSAADMASMQTTAEKSVVVVRYDGCTLELLEGCHLPGKYVFKETARSLDSVLVNSREKLYEKLPLGADNLVSRVESGFELELSYVSTGTLSARISDRSKGMLVGDCDGATHFVHSMITGAYELEARKGGVDSKVIRKGGDLKGCDGGASYTDTKCQAVVQAVLMPISQMSSDRDDLYADVSNTVSMEEAFRALSALAANGDAPPQLPPTVGTPPASTGNSPLAKKLGAIQDGGSDEWDGTIKPIMVAEFDKDGSGSIDTVEEVSAIPCDVLVTLDTSIKAGRGDVSALRTTYGFPDRYHWVGYALGFNEKVRLEADARLANCGL